MRSDGGAGRRHAIRSRFVDWDPRLTPGETWADTIAAAETYGKSLEVHWSPVRWNGGQRTEVLSPGQVARGEGDKVIVDSAKSLRSATRPVLLRFAAEMNGYWQPYSAFNRDGSPRDADHSSSQYIAAWRRVRTIFRGGKTADVNTRLKNLGQPALKAGNVKAVGAPDVTFVWAPNIGSVPRLIPGQQPDAYYPGDEFVDWVGVDVYDDNSWPVISDLLERHYSAHPSKPFALSEWGLKTGTDNADFVSRMFDWVESHPRVASMHWFDSSVSKLSVNPLTAATYRQRIGASRYLTTSDESSW